MRFCTGIFKNDADARTIVHEIETIIDNKFEKEKNQLATKDDINLFRQDFLKSQVDLEKRLNTVMVWMMATVISVGGLIIAFLKL